MIWLYTIVFMCMRDLIGSTFFLATYDYSEFLLSQGKTIATYTRKKYREEDI